jgi:O-antigen/teichoic acid export membrane protein
MGKSIFLKVVLPIIFGIIIGAGLFIWGELDDAPGLCAIGIAICLVLIYLGLRNLNKVQKNIKPGIVLPLFVGTVSIAYIAHYLIAGVYDEPPGLVAAGIVLSVGLIVIGLIRMKKNKKN